MVTYVQRLKSQKSMTSDYSEVQIEINYEEKWRKGERIKKIVPFL